MPDLEPDIQSDDDLRETFGTLWRRRWVVLACLVLLPALTYLVSSQRDERYEAETTLQVKAATVDTSLFVNEPAVNQQPQQPLAAAARLIKTTTVARRAAERLDPQPSDLEALLSQIDVDTDLDSGFLTVTAEDASPQRAAAIANGFGEALVDTRAERAREQIDAAIRQVESDLDGLAQGESGRRQLSQQLQRLRALRAAQGYNAEIVEPAAVPTEPSSPRPLRDAGIALLLAGLLGVGLAFLLERLDRRVRDAQELEELTGTSLLATIPSSAFRADGNSHDADEAFQTLRASLTFFNVDHPLDSVLIASPLKGDGKTTVALGLAKAYARQGRRVVLVETDLRDPQLAQRLNADPRRGLSGVLSDAFPLEDATLLVTQDEVPGQLTVIPSGALPPNPSELLASQRMRTLFEEMTGGADIVLVDTPAALAVSDAIPLFKQVSGVVLVGHVGSTTRDAMSRLTKTVANAGGTVLGVVATGVKASTSYGYGQYAGADAGKVPSLRRASANGRSGTSPRTSDVGEHDETAPHVSSSAEA